MSNTLAVEQDLYPQGTYKDIVDYVQETLGHDPHDVFVQVGRPKPGRMPGNVSLYVDSLIPDEFLRKVHIGDNAKEGNVNINNVVRSALLDTRDYLNDCFQRRFEDMTPEAAANIIHAPSTIHVLAGLALQAGSKEGEQTDMTPNYRRQFGINQDLTAIEPGQTFITDAKRGCPFAGKNGEIKPTPIFKELGVWCGTLAVHSYFNHFHGIDPTDALRAAEKHTV